MIYPPSVSSSYYDYELQYRELRDLLTFKNSRKRFKKYLPNKILQFVADNRNVSPSDLSKHFPYTKKQIEYGNAKRHLRDLRSMKLLETYESAANGNRGNRKLYYKLTKYGIYNLITNNRTLHFETVKNLLLNYSDHLLFGFFIFPYVTRETLSKIVDSQIFSQIYSYLYDCCKQLEEMIFSIDHTYNQKNGFLTDQLFIWQNIPSIHNDTEALRSFLKEKFKWHWTEMAEIKETENGNGITISYGLNSALIKIDRKKRNAYLSFKGKKEYEFIIRELDADKFVVEVPTDPLEDTYIHDFLILHVTQIPNFIISLVPLYGKTVHISLWPTIKILAQDKRFIHTLGKVKKKFDRLYDGFLDSESKSL
jgi:hypothetical protein